MVHSYIQQEVKIKWDVSIHGRDLYLLKTAIGPPKKFKHLTRAEEVVITRLRIGHTKATKSHILSRGPPTACQHCGQTLTIGHMLLECTVLQQIRDEYYTADSLRTLFETIPETCIVEFLREAGLFYQIWKAIYPVQHIIRITYQLTKFGIYINHHILTPLDSCNLFIEHKQLRKSYLWKTANMSLRTSVVVKQMQSNPIYWCPGEITAGNCIIIIRTIRKPPIFLTSNCVLFTKMSTIKCMYSLKSSTATALYYVHDGHKSL